MRKFSQIIVSGLFLCSFSAGAADELMKIDGITQYLNSTETPVLSNGYFRSEHGFLVEQSCKRRFEITPVHQVLHKVVNDGASCLLKLGTTEPVSIANKIGALLADRTHPPKLICNEDPKRLDSHKASSSFPNDPNHPFISMSHNYMSDKELPGVIFHELIHNTGFYHFENMEFPYTCAECCFPQSDLSAEAGKRVRQISCSICSGKYKSINDHEYMTELSEFFILMRKHMLANRFMNFYLDKNPNDRWAQFHVAEISGDEAWAPFGSAFGDQLEKKYSNLTEWEKQAITKSRRTRVEYFPDVGRQIARAYMFFVERKYEGAVDILRNVSIPAVPPNFEKPYLTSLNLKAMAQEVLQLILLRYKEMYDHAQSQREKDRVMAERIRVMNALNDLVGVQYP